MIRTVLCAAALSVVVIGGASAVPVPADKPVSVTTSDLVQVKKHKNKHWRHGGWNRGRYNYHHHYRHPPRGWRSYSYRPWGWQRRGCIIIGPVWYCP